MHYRLLLLLFLALYTGACSKKKSSNSTEFPRPVKVVKAESFSTVDKYYSGVVEAAEWSILAFKISGTLTTLEIEEGQRVVKGALIARLNPEDYELNYQTAQANYQAARSIYERTRRLWEQNAIALQNLEIAHADYVQSVSALSIAHSTLGYTRLNAPFQGFIEKKYVENHQQIMVGQPIVRLVNSNKLQVRIILPETAIQLINLPKEIYVRFNTAQWYQSEIKEYVYSSDESGIPVILRITDSAFNAIKDQVYPGFSCQVTFKIENTVSNKFIIPASALAQNGNNFYLWIVNSFNSTVHQQKVEIIRFNDQALVKEGLNPNDLIVVAGISDLKEGQKISL